MSSRGHLSPVRGYPLFLAPVKSLPGAFHYTLTAREAGGEQTILHGAFTMRTEMREEDRHKLSEILKATIGAKHSTAEVAELLGMAPATLRAELAAIYSDESHNKMGLVTAYIIAWITDNPGPLVEFTNRIFGYKPPVEQPRLDATGMTLESLYLIAAERSGELAKAIQEIHDPAGPGGSGVTKREVEYLVEKTRWLETVLLHIEAQSRAEVVSLRPNDKRKGG